MAKVKVNKGDIKAAKDKLVKQAKKEEAIEIAKSELSEDLKSAKLRPAVVANISKLMDENYWTYYYSKKELKAIVESWTNVVIELKAVEQEGDEVTIDWNVAPRPETDKVDYWEGIPQIFVERTSAGKDGLEHALLLVAKLASNQQLRDTQNWNDSDKTSWYAVAQDAIRLTKGAKTKDINGVIIPAISSGWEPDSSDPKKWTKQLKGYANTLLAAAKL